MPTPVKSHSHSLRLGIPTVALHNRLEDLDVGTVDDGVGGVAQRHPPLTDASVEVPLHAARVVLERVGRPHGADVDREVGERTRLDAAATRSGPASEPDGTPVRSDGLAVAAQGGLRAVEEGRLLDVVAVQPPFPVRNRAFDWE